MAFNGSTPDNAGYGTTNLYSQDPFAMAFNALQNAQQGHRTQQYRRDVQSANQTAAEQAAAQRQADAFSDIMSNAVTARDTPGFSTAAMAAMDQLSGSVGGRSFQPTDALMQLFSQRDQGLAQQPMAEAFQAQGAGASSYANAGQISSGFTPGEAPRSEVYSPLMAQAAGMSGGGGGGGGDDLGFIMSRNTVGQAEFEITNMARAVDVLGPDVVANILSHATGTQIDPSRLGPATVSTPQVGQSVRGPRGNLVIQQVNPDGSVSGVYEDGTQDTLVRQ